MRLAKALQIPYGHSLQWGMLRDVKPPLLDHLPIVSGGRQTEVMRTAASARPAKQGQRPPRVEPRTSRLLVSDHQGARRVLQVADQHLVQPHRELSDPVRGLVGETSQKGLGYAGE